MRYRISEAPWKLNAAGVRFYDHGTIKQGSTALFEYFKTDRITEDQIEQLRQYCPDLVVKESRMEYAPEIKSILVCFPKAGWYRQQKAVPI